MLLKFLINHHFSGFSQVFLVDAHEMCNKSFEVEDLLAAKLHSVLVQTGEAQNLCFDVDVAILAQDLNETLEDDVRWNALRKELVKTISDLLEALRCLLEQNLVCCFVKEALPVDLRHILSLREWILLDLAGFQHQNSSTEITIGLLGYLHR